MELFFILILSQYFFSSTVPVKLSENEITLFPLCIENEIKSDEGKLWPDAKDWHFYFECIGLNYFVRRPCPENTVFNYYKQQCTWPDEWRVAPFKSKNTGPTCTETELHILWPDPDIPSDFFMCHGIGLFERYSCPSGQTFFFNRQMCWVPEGSTTTPIPIERFPDCTVSELHIRWPSYVDPQFYFVCTGVGSFELLSCPTGMLFDFMYQMCSTDEINPIPTYPTFTTNIIESSTQSTSTIQITSLPLTTSTQQTTNSPSPMTSSSPTTLTNLVTNPSCTVCWRPLCTKSELHLKWPNFDFYEKYFECLSEGTFIQRACPENLLFNFWLQYCTPKENWRAPPML